MSLTDEQRRALEELGIERLKMRLDINITGAGPSAAVFGVKPTVTREQAEQWLVDRLDSEKRRDTKEKSDTLWWAKVAAMASVVVPLVIFLLERLIR